MKIIILYNAQRMSPPKEEDKTLNQTIPIYTETPFEVT